MPDTRAFKPAIEPAFPSSQPVEAKSDQAVAGEGQHKNKDMDAVGQIRSSSSGHPEALGPSQGISAAGLVLWGFRALTAVVAGVVIFLALRPPADGAGLLPWDKAYHILAFYILAVLTALSMKRPRLLAATAALLLVGAAIEGLQSLAWIGRDADWRDLAADAVGVALAYLPISIERLRRRLHD